MYRIFSDRGLIYDPQRTEEGYIVSAAKFTNQVDSAGSASFTIPATAVAANYAFWRLQTRIWITQDEPDEETGQYTVVWYGRIVDMRRDFNRNRVITCEGAIAFLNDVIVMPYTYWNRDNQQVIYNPDTGEYETWVYSPAIAESGGLPGLINPTTGETRGLMAKKVPPDVHISKLNAIYNQLCHGNRQLTLSISSTESYGIIEGVSSFTSILSNITNEIQKNTELMLYPYYYMENGEVGCTVHIQPMPYGTCSSQQIRFASNLLDLEECLSSNDLYDRIVAVGAGSISTYHESATTDYYLDVLDRDWYVRGRAYYGGVDKIITFNNIDDPDELRLAAEKVAELGGGMETEQFTLNAVDLHLLNVDITRIKFGWNYRVISEPHNLDDWYVCMKEDIDMLNPANSKYEFSKPQKLTPENLVDKFYDEVTGLYRAINQKVELDKPYGCVMLRQNELKLALFRKTNQNTGGVT